MRDPRAGTMQLGMAPAPAPMAIFAPEQMQAGGEQAGQQANPLLHALRNFSWSPKMAQSYSQPAGIWDTPGYKDVPGGSVPTNSGVNSMYAPMYQPRTPESWLPQVYHPVQGGSVSGPGGY